MSFATKVKRIKKDIAHVKRSYTGAERRTMLHALQLALLNAARSEAHVRKRAPKKRRKR